MHTYEWVGSTHVNIEKPRGRHQTFYSTSFPPPIYKAFHCIRISWMDGLAVLKTWIHLSLVPPQCWAHRHTHTACSDIYVSTMLLSIKPLSHLPESDCESKTLLLNVGKDTTFDHKIWLFINGQQLYLVLFWHLAVCFGLQLHIF